jgi:hypothetical protein
MKYLFLAIVVAAASVAHAADSNEVSAEQTKAWIGLFDKVVNSVVDNRSDCERMAAQINGLAVANQQTIQMAREAKAAGKHLPASAQQHMLDSARRMLGALDKCGRDDKVAAAFRHLDLGH